MSLSKLPDLVKSQICSFLDFNEIKNLEQTNKRIQFFLRKYKLDKPNFHALSFSHGDPLPNVPRDHVKCCASIEKDSKLIDLPKIEYQEEMDNHSLNVLNYINKFNSIDELNVTVVSLNENAGWVNVSAKIKFANISMTKINYSRDTLIQFFKQCRNILLFGAHINTSYIDDQLFTVLSDNGTTLLFMGMHREEVAVTDMTLEHLSKKNLHCNFSLNGLITDISFGGIKNMIEAGLTSELPSISWDFGFLKVDQFPQVCRFVDEKFKDWAENLQKPLYLEHSDGFDHDAYTIYDREKNNDAYRITFAVKKPEERHQTEAGEGSDDEIDSDDEDESGVEDEENANESMEENESGEDDPMDD